MRRGRALRNNSARSKANSIEEGFRKSALLHLYDSQRLSSINFTDNVILQTNMVACARIRMIQNEISELSSVEPRVAAISHCGHGKAIDRPAQFMHTSCSMCVCRSRIEVVKLNVINFPYALARTNCAEGAHDSSLPAPLNPFCFAMAPKIAAADAVARLVSAASEPLSAEAPEVTKKHGSCGCMSLLWQRNLSLSRCVRDFTDHHRNLRYRT